MAINSHAAFSAGIFEAIYIFTGCAAEPFVFTASTADLLLPFGENTRHRGLSANRRGQRGYYQASQDALML